MPKDKPLISDFEYAESLWNDFKNDPASVPDTWRDYFEEMDSDSLTESTDSLQTLVGHQQLHQGYGPGGKACMGCGRAVAMSLLQYNVSELIRNYRVRGHRASHVNPLETNTVKLEELSPEYYGISKEDFKLLFNAGSLSEEGPLALEEILKRLKTTYCQEIGVQFMHIDKHVERMWLQNRMEKTQNKKSITREQQKRIMTRLTDAVVFEQFLQLKFVGAKSFSLEGAETLIPLLDMAIEKAGDQGIEEITIGMPHRGRLNVLCNIMGKPPSRIFREFRDEDAKRYIGSGDVRHHLGYRRKWKTESGKLVKLDLTFNPSHLEFVGPVAQGKVKSKMDRTKEIIGDKNMLILMHGDASIIGEGIVQETFNLSELDGFKVGGTLHIVVNNQLGFTTLSQEGRSSLYATDIAKMLQIPILHVNGENPEAVAQALDLALDFRKEFRRDVVIDMYCYRRRGHNEGDEPKFTQPLMYKTIEALPTVMESYKKYLASLGGLSEAEISKIEQQRLTILEAEFDAKTETDPEEALGLRPSIWNDYHGGIYADAKSADTAVSKQKLKELVSKLVTVPETFNPHKKILKILKNRDAMGKEERLLDWGLCESLALASLAADGTRIRLSGQDSQRGTFSHRHSVLHDVQNGSQYMALSNLTQNQGTVEIINSPLSEGAVVGFEYGYSTASPDALVIWEAQFGDFANTAQVYIDQFISSGEVKWNLPSGIVLLLPHGLEGTGPEHASARLERYLSLAASDNYQVTNPTTPAQIFHLLRRQVKRKIRKPLIVMSPKSMLRHPKALSSMDELSSGKFQNIINDTRKTAHKVDRIILCSGKIYYELLQKRDEDKFENVAIVRIEQLYPLEWRELEKTLLSHNGARDVVWVQEEPSNMGALSYIQLKYSKKIEKNWSFSCVSRPETPSPATGSASSHKLEQSQILEQAFNQKNCQAE